MIYDRPDGKHHPIVRGCALVLALATAVLTWYWSPPEIHAQVEWRNPVSLKPLPSSDATGRAAPNLANDVVDGSFGVATSTTPILTWRNVPDGVGQVTFKITSLASANPTTVWQQTVAVDAARTARATVAAGRLQQGRAYIWEAQSSSNAAVNHGPFALNVDVQRAGVQELWSSAGVSVAQTTGELVYGWTGPSIDTLAGPMGWDLVYRPTNRPDAGLPRDWSLVAGGTSSWESLTRNADGSVTLVDTVGWSVTFTKRGANLWQPRFGPNNDQWRQGSPSLLAENADGTFSITDGNRTVTVFGAPTAEAPVTHPTAVWVDGAPTFRQVWANGRLAALLDPVSGDAIQFLYGGEPACAMTLDEGFIATPDGLLCSVQDSTGNMIAFEYVQTPTGPQIGRIVAGLGLGVLAQVYDFGWDKSGRLASLRQPRAATAIASGVIEGLAETDMRATTQIEYDAAGRVAKVVAPAPLRAGENATSETTMRSTQTFTYAPFSVKVDGVATPAGSMATAWSDPETMLTTKTRDAAGRITVNTYNAQLQLVRQVDQSSGTATETVYDAQGQPIENLGPSRAPLTGAQVPKVKVAYDQNEAGRDWTGLATRYWNNADFSGAPADGTTGPILPGATAPVNSLSFNWTGNPAGGTGAWSARLTGVYEAPADGTYAFRSTTAAKLWVNGVACLTTCSPTLGKGGTAALQVDVVSPGGAAGVNVLVKAPDAAEAAVPRTALRPNYQLPTSTTTRERSDGGELTSTRSTRAGGTDELTTRSIYNPVTAQLMATETPMGEKVTRTYAPYDPANDLWGQSTSVTDASGKTTTTSFYGFGATATDCAGQTVVQTPGVATTAGPSAAVTVVTGPGGGVVKTETPAGRTCGSYADGGLSYTTETTGIGDPYTVTSNVIVDGNPLVADVVTRDADGPTRERSYYDINGNVWKTIDAHGTVVVNDWDPRTQLLERVTQTTAKGARRVTSYTYTPSGDTHTITVDGRLLVTNTYRPDGLVGSRAFGNGSTETYGYDANNNQNLVERTFADGSSVSERVVHSPTGRILSRTLTGPTGTATYAYTYNRDGRLIDTELTGTAPTLANRWRSEYTGKEAANGNRTASITTGANGTRTSTFTYGADNNLVASTQPNLASGIVSDAAGRITRLGAVTLGYDAVGHLRSASQGGIDFQFRGDEVRATHTAGDHRHTIVVRSSGVNLLLDGQDDLAGQVVQLTDGVSVAIEADGTPATWHYADQLGNDTWRTTGGDGPKLTRLYSPSGNAITSLPVTDPTTPLALVEKMMGWQATTGVETLPFATKVMLMGARQYSPDANRFLQPDPVVNASLNAYEYAVGDPINQSDPSGQWSRNDTISTVVGVVAGLAIGFFTCGIGTAAVATYGIGHLAAQVALGAVSGAVASALANTAVQLIEGGEFNWTTLGIEAAKGAGWGAAGALLMGLAAKVVAPRVRYWAVNRKAPGADYLRGGNLTYGQARKAYLENNADNLPSAWKGFWKGNYKKAAAGRGAESTTGIRFGTTELQGVLRGSGPLPAVADDGAALISRTSSRASSILRPGTVVDAADDVTQIAAKQNYVAQSYKSAGVKEGLVGRGSRYTQELDDAYAAAYGNGGARYVSGESAGNISVTSAQRFQMDMYIKNIFK